jgi:transglutaminase-like putative cysteine protease
MLPCPPFRLLSLFLCCLFLCVAAAPVFAGGGDDAWRPIEPAQLALKKPVVEPDADAEILFWEARVLDEIKENVDSAYPRTVINHYIRVKVFTDRGRESQSKIDVPFGPDVEIKDIAARTIKPDGSIVELTKKDFFERTIIKAGGVKVKAKSFAMPAVEPGAIIEYRWREVRNNSLSFYERLDFQRDIPAESVTYYVKPLLIPGLGFRLQYFNGRIDQSADKKDGFVFSMANVPAFHEEPNMPPEYQVRPYLLIYYTAADQDINPATYWTDYGKEVFNDYKSSLKVKDDVRAAATEAVGDAATPDEKLERILAYCRAKIKNTSDDASGLTDADREKLKENKTPSDTLKRGMGTGRDIALLFSAMATAAGFESRVAKIGNRDESFFDKRQTNRYFLSSYDIAVKVGEEWRIIDPASTYVPYGMLLWQEEGQEALVSDAKEPFFVHTPISGPDKSVERRTAKLKLAEDGALEGDVRIEYTGHLAMDKKEQNDDDSPTQREENLKEMIKAQMSTAELSEIKIENVTDPVKPFVYAFHVRVPGYAQRTGKRLFLQPNFFQHGIGALFSATDRRYGIYFHYPWTEKDTVEIELPVGFSLDSADSPGPFAAADVGKYDLNIGVSKDDKTLVYQRQFTFGTTKDLTYFVPQYYPGIKQIFDELYKRDNHTITLKQAATTASATPNQ